ncbi:DUF397 domain-containing protein [Streptomyces sp. NPDC047046]|uniref:DUF397 domain-containing protein n=1 Tax=Streptomyces sp. NPDC047046 TaxID=3155378 RepID=UPI0033E36A09
MIRQHHPNVWFKSSYSSAQGACVEVNLGGLSAAFRDSKEPQRPAVEISRAAWSGFVRGLASTI